MLLQENLHEGLQISKFENKGKFAISSSEDGVGVN